MSDQEHPAPQETELEVPPPTPESVPPSRDDVRAALLAWLESERLRIRDLAAANGIPLSVVFRELYASDIQETGAQYAIRDRRVSTFGAYFEEGGQQLMVALAKTALAAPEPPTVLVDRYKEKCQVWAIWGGAGRFDDFVYPTRDAPAAPSPEAWFGRELTLKASSEYVSQVESLDNAEPETANAIVDGLLELVEQDNALLVAEFPFAGFRLAETVTADGVEVRTLTPEEIGALSPAVEPPRLRIARRNRRIWNGERCALVVRERFPKVTQPKGQRVHAVVLALQLLGFHLRGTGDATYHTTPGPSLLDAGGRVYLPDFHGPIRDFKRADLDEAIALANLIPSEALTAPKDSKGIALHRFRTAVCERSDADAILDFTIALESILVPEDMTDVSFRFRLNGARFLTADKVERQQVYDQLKVLYKVRSEIAHGSKGHPEAQLVALRDTARDLAQRVILKVLRQRWWPTKKDLDDLQLS